MSNNESYGQLYEIFVERVFEYTVAINDDIEKPNVNATQMIDLVDAEEAGRSPEYIAGLFAVVQDRILIALVRLHHLQPYEWRKSVISNLISKAHMSTTSKEMIQVINQAVNSMILDIG